MNLFTCIVTVLAVLGGLAELFIYVHSNGLHRRKPQHVPDKFDVGSLQFWALGDRVLIEEDEFRSGYECPQCDGTGKVKCDNCSGTTQTATGKKCGLCADGTLTCPKCEGKGGLLITPETSQRRPTSGMIVSAGPNCESLKVGDSVLYSNFAGYVVDLNRAGQPVTLRILHETEVLSGMSGHLTLTNLHGKSDLTSYTP